MNGVPSGGHLCCQTTMQSQHLPLVKTEVSGTFKEVQSCNVQPISMPPIPWDYLGRQHEL
jgi:hypothetical protein